MKPNNKEKKTNQICRAFISPGSEDAAWDFEAVAVPFENKKLMYSYENDEYFYQVLRTNTENIQSDRLDSGLPLFDNHPWEKSAMNTLGITVEYEITEEGLVVRGKFGARADEALKNDVKNGIIKTVSIEGDVLRYNREYPDGEVPIYYTELWQPTSLSFAPVPNDIAAQIEVKRALEVQLNKAKQPESDNLLNTLIEKF